MMRYYHYVSTSKVDMLFPQIPAEFLQGIGGELGFNFGFLAGKLSSTIEPPQERYAKLMAIEKYLAKGGKISTEPVHAKWFRGEIAARMGGIDDAPRLFLICSRVGLQTRIFAGSSDNLVSQIDIEGVNPGYSFFPRMLGALEKYVKRDYDDRDAERAAELSSAPGFIFGDSEISGAMFRSLWDLPEDKSLGPVLRVNVMARIFLAEKRPTGKELILGSPLYVAEAV